MSRSEAKPGLHSNIKRFRGIGEYVLDWGPGYRIYLMTDGDDLIVLLGGGTNPVGWWGVGF